MHERRILLDQNVPKWLLLYLSDHQFYVRSMYAEELNPLSNRKADDHPGRSDRQERKAFATDAEAETLIATSDLSAYDFSAFRRMTFEFGGPLSAPRHFTRL